MNHVGTAEELSTDRKCVERVKPITWLLWGEGPGRSLLAAYVRVELRSVRVRLNERDNYLHELVDIELLLLPVETWLSLVTASMWGLWRNKYIFVQVFGDRRDYLVGLQRECLVICRALRVFEELSCVFHLGLKVEKLLERVIKEHDLSS